MPSLHLILTIEVVLKIWLFSILYHGVDPGLWLKCCKIGGVWNVAIRENSKIPGVGKVTEEAVLNKIKEQKEVMNTI